MPKQLPRVDKKMKPQANALPVLSKLVGEPSTLG